MTPERWQKLNQLFDLAIELPADQRPAFLSTACEGDSALRVEVERLLAAAETGAKAIGATVGQAAADFIAAPQTVSSIGQVIGVYKVVRALGKGGMGEVFLALDPRLDRHIALKLLARHFTADPRRVRRFQREARLASGLNHPNILVVHELGEFEGRQFIATEYVEGRTLRAELSDGPMTAGRVLDIAIQTTAALSAAHQAGIVHRDVKPENIMVRPDGYVKVLDFGLAKLTERDSAGGGMATDTFASMPGVVFGTADYMSPEQVRGETVDPRSDVFSLGIVLYELVTGNSPFHGATPADSLSLILQAPLPPLIARAPAAPPQLSTIVEKMLARKMDERYQSMTKVHGELKALKQELDARALIASQNLEAGSRPHRRSILAWGAAATGALGAAFIGSRYLRPRPAVSFDSVRISRVPTSNDVTGGLISPDGRYILTVRDSEGKTSLWAKPRVGSTEEIPVAPPAAVSYWGLTYSPDGNYLFCTVANRAAGGGGVLYRQPALGGNRERIATGVDSSGVSDGSGKRVLFRRNHARGESPGLFLAEGGAEEMLAISDEPYAFYFYGWTAAGKAVRYVSGSRLYSSDWTLKERVPGSTRETTILRDQQGPIGFPATADPSGIYAVSADPDSGLRQICYISLTDGRRSRITHDAAEYVSQSVTADGKIILANQQTIENDVWIAKLGSTAQPQRITNGAGWYAGLNWLPGGKLVAAISTAGATDLYVMDGDGGNLRQLTTSGDVHSYAPAVSRDGRFVLFSAGTRGAADLRVAEVDTGRVRQIAGGQHVGDAAFSADGSSIYYVAARVSDWALWKVPFDGGASIRLLDCEESRPAISPDGTTLAAISPDRSLVLLNLTTGESTRKPLARNAGDLSWTSREAVDYSVESGPDCGVWRLPLNGAPAEQLLHPGQARMWGYSVESGGKRVAYVAGRARSNLMQISNLR